MSNYASKVATNIFPIGIVMVRSIVVCMVAGSFSASLWLINDCMAPLSKIANTANLRVLVSKNKRLCCILMLLKSGWPTFPTYLMSASYVSFPVPSPGSCPAYSASSSYCWDVASSILFSCLTRTYMVDPDNIWLYFQSSCNSSISVLTVD